MTSLMTMEHSGGNGTSVDVANYNRRWWILAVLGVAQLMVILDSTIVNIALPTAQQALRFSNADRQWIVTAYSLAFGSLLLLGGRIGDMIGRKRGAHHRAGRLRPGLSHRWFFGQLLDARHCPDSPGRIRCSARTLGAGALDDHLHRYGRARAGLRDLRSHRRRRRRAWSPPWRRAHLVCVVALDALRQSRVCCLRHRRRSALVENRRGG